LSPDTTPERAINPWLIAVAVMSATFMEVLDTTVVNVSLPHVAGNLSASIDESTWVLTSYLVANAIILPLAGWLARRFGRKRLLMLSVSGFTAASFLCGLAPSLPLLILFRVIQGTTGGALQPLSQAVLLEAFPPEQRGRAMAFWGLGIVVAPILGPVLGGWLTDSYSWRWVFYINIPIGMIALVMIERFVHDPPYLTRGAGRVDWTGIGLLALGIGALQIFLDKGQEDDWFASDAMTMLAIVSALSLAAFLVHELRAGDPVVDLRVLRVRTFSAGVVLMTVVGFVLFGSLVLLPIFLQTLLGYPALQAGAALRAAHHDQHGPDPARVNGQRDQHLQPDAQHRWQPGYRRGDDDPRAPPAASRERAQVACRRVQPADASPVRANPGSADGAWLRRGHGRPAGPGRRERLCPTAGGRPGVHGRLPDSRSPVPAGLATPALDEAPPLGPRSERCALSLYSLPVKAVRL